jgi:putative aminopeptidase FrvX
MPIPPLLGELLRAPGPSGAEEAVTAIVRREAAALGADVEGDVLGSTVARVRGTEGGRTLALIAHVDQVGIAITRFDDDGGARIAPLGSWAAKNAVGARFRVLTARGPIAGVAVRVGDEGDPTWAAMRLDLGAGDAVAARALAAPGDAGVMVGEPVALAGGRIVSTALDDRLGVYAALEALRGLAAEPSRWDVVLVASVQEESGGHAGATAVAARLAPDVARSISSP